MKSLKRTVSKILLNNMYLKISLDQEGMQQKQEENFLDLKKKLHSTDIAFDHKLDSIENYNEFIQRVESREYDKFAPYVESLVGQESRVLFKNRVQCFGLTSGTSGQDSKRVPYNKDMIDIFKRAQKYQASVINHIVGGVDLVNSPRLSYGSTPKNYTANGVEYGYISGILSSQTPKMLKKVTFPSQEILEIEDWNEKIQRIVEQSTLQDIKIASAIPTYLIAIFEEVLKTTGKEYIKDIWPNLDTIIYGATPIDSYKERINQLVGKRLNYFGVYASTEAPIGIGINNAKDDKQLYAFNPDLIYSFESTETNECLPIGRVVAGGEYLLNITTPNGFLNYTMKDIVRIKSTSPILTFEILGRQGSGINLGAEKTSDQQVLDTVVELNKGLGKSVDHYFLSPGTRDEKACYKWTLFSNQLNVDVKFLEKILDEAMSLSNPDYLDCREQGIIASPIVEVVTSDILDEYFSRFREKGQFKMKTVFSCADSFNGFIKSVLPELSVVGISA